jgi:copper transport protein
MKRMLVSDVRRRRILAAAVLLAILPSIFIPSIGFAHANQLRSDPADGSVLEESPREISIWFDEPISDRFSSVQLFDVDSKPIEVTGLRRDSSDPTLLIISVPELEPGVYSILWKILSEVDGHYNQGLLVFGVGEDVDLGAASVAPVEGSGPSTPEVLFRWLNLLMLSGLIGGVAMIQLVIRPAKWESRYSAKPLSIFQTVTRRILKLAVWCASGGILVGVGLLFWQASTLQSSLPEGAAFLSAIEQTLAQTQWGTVWIARQGFYLFAGVSVLSVLLQKQAGESDQTSNRSQIAWLLVFVFSLALIVAQALSSHAAGLAEHNTLAVISHALHLTGAILWVGGMLALGAGLLPLARDHREDIGSLVQVGWRPFSKVAGFSVGLLMATGLYNSGRQVASFDALLTTLYGQALIVKLGLLLIIGYFGFVNTSLLHSSLSAFLKKLGSSSGWTPLEVNRLPRLIITKGGLSILVLLLTGLITAAPSPRGSTFTVDPEDVPSALSQNVDDLVITLGAKPNRPGQNVFTVFAASTRRPAPVEISRVILRFTNLDQDIGRESVTLEEVGRDRYLLGGNYLRLAGNWQIDVVVRRLGMEDSVAHFNWVVAPPGEARPVVVSKAPLGAPLSLIAALTLLLIPFHTLIVFLVRSRKTPRRSLRNGRKKIYRFETLS